MPTVWEDQSLDDVAAATWTSAANVTTLWRDNWLHKVSQFGGVEPMGSGPFGDTAWSEEL